MKKNDLIALIFALVLLVGAGYYFISQNGPKATATTSTATQVDVAPTIPDKLDGSGTVSQLTTTYNVRDYKQPLNLSGLGNSTPFGN